MTDKPINIITGNKYFKETDYTSGGPFPLRFRRYYNSLNQDNEQLGWSYDYLQHLEISVNVVKAYRADGKELSFYLDGTGLNWQPEFSRREQLIKLLSGEWEIRSRGFRERYSSNGSLISITSPQGLTHTLNYVGDNVEVSHAGRKLVLTLNGAGMITALTTPDLRTINYDYVSGSGVPKLIKVNYPTSSISYLYQDARFPLNITRIENDQGQVLSEVTYNALGRAATSGLANGAFQSSIAYIDDENSYRREVTNALGKTAVHHYAFTDVTPAPGERTIFYPSLTRIEGQASASCAASDSEYTYDIRGFKDSFTDSEGNITLYQHDARGNEASRTEAYGTTEERTITTEWHADYALPIKITEPDRVTDFQYDSNGYLLNKTVTATAP